MALDLTQPADLLKYILALDLNQCGIAVCIASGDPDEMIARGVHKRAVVRVESFARRVARKTASA